MDSLSKNKKKMSKIKEYKKKIESLSRYIKLYEEKKRDTEAYVKHLDHKHLHKQISYEERKEELKKGLGGKTEQELIKEYDECIDYNNNYKKHYEKQLKQLRRERNVKLLGVTAVLLLLALGIFFLKPTITGYVTGVTTESYSETLDLSFSESQEYVLELEQIGKLQSIRLSGEIIGDGVARVYIEKDDIKYLVLDNKALEEEGIKSVTGMVVSEGLAENVTELINETLVNETIEEYINVTEPVVNETIEINETNKTITINLEYKSGTQWDSNDDGIEEIEGVIDFTVEKTEFNWDVDESKLCTKWGVYSEDSTGSTIVCYGSVECCGIIDLTPTLENWNELFDLYYERYGATENNEVSAQVIYADYKLSVQEAYTDIYYSGTSSLSARFYTEELPVIKFEDICVETCSIDLDSEDIKLIIELENATINLDSISYTVIEEKINNAPKLIANISNITINKNEEYRLDLSNYFYDEDNDTLVYSYYKTDNISVSILNNTATLTPDKGFSGTVFMYFTANDSEIVAVSNLFKIDVVEEITEVNVTLTPKLESKKQHFKLDEDVEFDFEYLKEEELTKQGKLLTKSTKEKQKKTWKTDKETIETYVYDSNGELTTIEPEIEEIREGKFKVSLQKQRSFKPGKYSIKLDLTKDGVTYTQEQDFTWGVLAINTHKSIYLENETSFIAIAILDDQGHTVCDANVTLLIIDPNGEKTILSTLNEKILISEECTYGVTGLPDYSTEYNVGDVGTYVMNLTAETYNGIRSITDGFVVQKKVDFDVSRKGPTRIFPPVNYSMNITIIANKNYNGEIREYIPASFEVMPQDGLIVQEVLDTKVLIWNLNLKKGNEYKIYYEFKAPDITPELYLLGSLEIGNFKEVRQWMIGADATSCADSAISAGTNPVTQGSTTAITGHTLCTGAGGKTYTVQLNDDTVQILNSPTGVDFYCPGSASVTVNTCECDSCTKNADCTVAMANCGNADDIDITWTITASGNNEALSSSNNIQQYSATAGTTWNDVVAVTINAPADITPPTLSGLNTNATNKTERYQTVNLSAICDDDVAAGKTWYGKYNQTDYFNGSKNGVNTSVDWVDNVIYTHNITINEKKGVDINLTYYCNDSSGNNASFAGWIGFTVNDLTAPTLSGLNTNATNKTKRYQTVNLSAICDDTDSAGKTWYGKYNQTDYFNGSKNGVNTSVDWVDNVIYTHNITINEKKGVDINLTYYCNDSSGNNASFAGWIGFTVNNTQPKYSGQPSINDTTPRIADDINCSLVGATFTDVDGDTQGTPEYRWFMQNEGGGDFTEIGGATSAALTVSGNADKDDVVRCGVRAYDGSDYNDNRSNSTNIAILNTAPTYTGAPTINKTSPTKRDTINCSLVGATFTDADSDSEGTPAYQWYNKSITSTKYEPITGGTNSVLDLNSYTAGMNFICGVKAYDGTSYADYYVNSSNVATIDNRTPQYTGLATNATNKTKTGWTVNLTILNVTDNNGTGQIWYGTYNQTGFYNGTHLGENTSVDWYSGADYTFNITINEKKGADINLTVYFNDSSGNLNNSAGWIGFTVNNTAPKYSGQPSINDTTPRIADDINCSLVGATFTDVDTADSEGTPEYRWFLQDEGSGDFTQLGEATSVLTISGNADEDDKIKCGVRAYDGTDYDDNRSNSSNIATVSPDDIIKPLYTNLTTNATNATKTGEDVSLKLWNVSDETSPGQIWYGTYNQTGYYNGTHNGENTSVNWLNAHDYTFNITINEKRGADINLTVYFNDSIGNLNDTGIWLGFTVNNTQPKYSGEPSINDTTPLVTEHLNCSLVGATWTDADIADSEGTPEYRWFNQSQGTGDWYEVTGGTSASISLADMKKDDKIKCGVRAYDGSDYDDNRSNSTVVTIQNSLPVITWVNQSAQIDPVDSSDVTVALWFNVSDGDGYADIDADSANMTVNESDVSVNATQCWSVQNLSTWGMYNCSINMKYWYNASSNWRINASIKDNSGVKVSNATETFTYNELSAMQLPVNYINFSGITMGSENVSANNNPFIINNTGNDDFDVINMTASHLRGMNTTTETLNVQNISINWTGSEGFALNNSNQTLTGLTLPHGESPISNKSINFYITVPSDSGLTPQDFNATEKWTVTVYDVP